MRTWSGGATPDHVRTGLGADSTARSARNDLFPSRLWMNMPDQVAVGDLKERADRGGLVLLAADPAADDTERREHIRRRPEEEVTARPAAHVARPSSSAVSSSPTLSMLTARPSAPAATGHSQNAGQKSNP